MRRLLTPFHIFFSACAVALLIFALSFVSRTNPKIDDFYMVPLWALLLILYAYWGIYSKRLPALHVALLPLALLAVVEIAWGSIAFSGRLIQSSSNERQATEQNTILQTKIDTVYAEFFSRKLFFSDGFRAYVLPANAKTPYFTTNEDGFRTRPKAPKPAGTIRIALLGGSSAFGWQAVSDENTLAPQIELDLNRIKGGGRKFEIVNFSVPTGNSFIDRSIIARYTDLYEIDALLFVTGSNDLNGSTGNIDAVVTFASDYLNRSEDLPYLLHLWGEVTRKLLLRAVDRIRALNYIVKNFLSNADGNPWVGERKETDAGTNQKFITEYMSNMEDIYKFGKLRHIPVLVFHQPSMKSTLYNLAPKLADDADRKALAELKAKGTDDPELKLSASGVPVIVELGDTVARQYGFRYLNGNEAFRNFNPRGGLRQSRFVNIDPAGPLFISSSHYSPAGVRLLAHYIAQTIVDLNVVGR